MRVGLTSLSLTILGCGAADSAPPGEASSCFGQPIIHGAAAFDARLAAVGSIGSRDESGRFRAQCSGSLIAPDLVLTAKHCALGGDGELALNRYAVEFALGVDAARPDALVEAVTVELSTPDSGGVAELGSDVALYRLDHPLGGVAPMRLFAEPLSDQRLGAELTVYGFGTDVPGCDREATFRPVRRAGQVRLSALRGNVFDDIYGDEATFLADALHDMGGATAEWRYAHGGLLEDYEAWVTAGPDGAQACHGDSGGPIVIETERGSEVIGVLSWSWRSQTQQCDHGSVIAVFGPQTRALLLRSLP
jgi:hypothetical protein